MSRRSYGTGNLWLRGKVWWIRYREVVEYDGVRSSIQRYESTKSEDKKHAQKILNSKLQTLGGHRPTVVDPKKVTYEILRENFLARCRKKELRALKRVGTEEQSLDTLPRLDGHFAGWLAQDISRADIDRFRELGKNDGLSDKRLNRYVATLRSMFNQAAKDELITQAEIPAYFPQTKEPNEAVGAVYIKTEWYKPLRRLLREPIRSAFTLAYHTSIRVGEMERLRWRHFEFKKVNGAKGIIHLPGEITKSGKPRDIWIPMDFDLKPGKPDDLPLRLGNYRRQWWKACVAVGAGKWEKTTSGRKVYVGAKLRHCRHTAIRDMVDSGLDRDRAKAISGHLTDSMFSRYNIGKEEDVLEAARSVARLKRG